MFFTYLTNELRRRWKQASVVALGLAVGVGLVVTVGAASAGVRDAQSEVLASLYGIGTDLTVTQQADPADGPGAGFRVGGNGEEFDRTALVLEPGKAAFSQERVDRIATLDGVSRAVGSLTLTQLYLSGELPSFDVGGGTEQGTSSAPPQLVTTGPGEFDLDSATVTGVDVSDLAIGPMAALHLSGGRSFTATDERASVAVLDAGYATQQELAVGEDVTVGGKDLEVVGIVQAPVSGGGSDVYIPLAKAQALADLQGKIDEVAVQASDASVIETAQVSIETTFPNATVSTTSELADQVTGSLGNAADLASNLGRWLSIATLAAAIVLACLLTLAAVGRRVRELGTLKAIGWRSRRVVGQVMGESVVQGVLGGALGIVLGLLGVALVARVAPTLTASPPGAGFFGAPGGGPDP
jgi:ABC-type antimicrobial peptide transport system permease subunit